jgi:hypothetical protein
VEVCSCSQKAWAKEDWYNSTALGKGGFGEFSASFAQTASHLKLNPQNARWGCDNIPSLRFIHSTAVPIGFLYITVTTKYTSTGGARSCNIYESNLPKVGTLVKVSYLR